MYRAVIVDNAEDKNIDFDTFATEAEAIAAVRQFFRETGVRGVPIRFAYTNELTYVVITKE